MYDVLDALSPYIGMALLAIAVAVLHHLGTREEKKSRKSLKHKRP